MLLRVPTSNEVLAFVHTIRAPKENAKRIHRKADFNQNLVISRTEFFVPTEDGIRKIANPVFDEKAVKWQGFKDIESYCKNKECQ